MAVMMDSRAGRKLEDAGIDGFGSSGEDGTRTGSQLHVDEKPLPDRQKSSAPCRSARLSHTSSDDMHPERNTETLPHLRVA